MASLSPCLSQHASPGGGNHTCKGLCGMDTATLHVTSQHTSVPKRRRDSKPAATPNAGKTPSRQEADVEAGDMIKAVQRASIIAADEQDDLPPVS